MARRTLIDFFDDLVQHQRRVPGLRRRLSQLVVQLPRHHGSGARLRRAPARRGHHPAASTSSSGARTVRSGSSRCGAACCAASSSCRSTTAPPQTSCAAWPRIVDARADHRRRRGARPRRHGRAGLEDRRRGLPRRPARAIPAIEHGPDDVAEVIFTSGATSEPKGVVLTHRNILANIVPIEREIAKYRKYARPFLPHPVPEPPAAEPHVRAGDGDLRAAAALGRGRLQPHVRARRDRRADSLAAHFGAGVACRRSSRSCATTCCTAAPETRDRLPTARRTG